MSHSLRLVTLLCISLSSCSDLCRWWPHHSACAAPGACGPGTTDSTGGDGAVTCYYLEPRDSTVALLAVDLTSNAQREVTRWSGGPGSSFHTSALAYDGRTFVTPGYDGNGFSWYALDPSVREIRDLGGAGYASGVAWTGSDWLAPDTDDGLTLGRFSSLEALSGSSASCTTPGGQFTRFAVAGNRIYGAWHSTDHVDVHELTTGTLVRSIPLEGWGDNWVMGISVAGGALHVIGAWNGASSTTIASFNLESGARRSQVTLTDSVMPSGLYCTTRPLQAL